jgi:hypothetical protein
MSHTITNSNSVNESPALAAPPHSGCKHHTRKGRCRMPVADPATSLCFDHARRRNKRDEASNLAAELVAGLSEFKSAVPINDFLSRLLHFQAHDRIQPRRAAVMAYTCNLLLRTLPAIERELHPEDEIIQVDFGDLPRPGRPPNPSQDYPRQT